MVRSASLATTMLVACTLAFEPRSEPDGGAGQSDASSVECELFADDFEGASQDNYWRDNSFNDPPSRVMQEGGELAFTFGTSSSPKYAGYLSDEDDFTNTFTQVRVVDVPNPSSSTQVLLKYEIPWPDIASLHIENGQLSARLDTNQIDELESVRFDPIEHRFLRLSHRDGDTLDWQVSADGERWTTLASRNGVSLTRAKVGVIGGTWQSEPDPGTARFDDFVVGCPSE